MDFQDEKDAPAQKVARNPNNFNILKGGKVDPGSKLYQRSVAGRQKLEDYVKDLWDQGKDEKDVFMAAVESLMNRGHGYVGAYLDSKNPGRRYTEPQAMKIADEVMKNAGIGSHPGARLTPAKSDEEREARKGDRAQRREARKAGPAPAPGQKAKPVGQQRKEGRRTGTEPVAEDDTRRAGIDEPATGPVSDWQKTLEDRMEGKATTSDVLAAFQKQYQSRIGGGKTAKSKATAEAAPAQPTAEPRTPAPAKPEQTQAPTPDEAKAPEAQTPTETGSVEGTDRIAPTLPEIGDKFKELVEDSAKAGIKIDANSLEGMIQETIEILEDDYDVDPEVAREAILRRFNNKLISGQKIKFDPSSAPDKREVKEAAPKPAEPAPDVRQALKTAGLSMSGAPESSGGSGISVDSEDLGREIPLSDPKAKEILKKAGLTTEQAESYWMDRLKEMGALDERDYPKQEIETPAKTTKNPVTSKGGFRAPKQPSRRGGGGFTAETGKKAANAIRQAVSEGKTPQEVMELFKQGELFGGAGFETGSAATNPLEGGRTPENPVPGGVSTPPQEERGGSLLDEQGQAKDFRKSGPQTARGGTARQLPLPLGRENTAAKLKGRADVEKRRLAKQEKSLGKPAPRPRKTGKSPTQPELFTKSGNPRKFNTSEMSSMSYDEFAQSVRSLLR